MIVGFIASLSFLVFLIGCFSLCINRQNLIFVLIAFEIMLLASGINFVGFSYIFNDVSGKIAALFILSIAACEVAVGLALLSVHFKSSSTIDIEDLSNIKD